MKNGTALIISMDVKEHAQLIPILENAGYSPISAYTGLAGTRHFFESKQKPSLLIVSDFLRDMKVDEILPSLRATDPLPHTIILDHFMDAEWNVKYMRSGANDILEMPFHDMELSVLLGRILEPQTILENIAREMEQSTERSIKSRLESFRNFIAIRMRKNAPLKPSEVQLFFPSPNTLHNHSPEELLEILSRGIHNDKSLYSLVPKMEKPHLLVVEDEPLIRSALYLALGTEFELVQTESAEQALEVLDTLTIPLHGAIVDIGLPGMSGDDFVSHLKQKRPNLLIMMMTAYMDTDLIVKCFQNGASDYIIKPFENRVLLNRIVRAVQRNFTMQHLAKWMEIQKKTVTK
jgi:DNA-binding response OmpR family regulator